MLIALFERTVSLYGELINVNAYHQPGVEAGKKAATEVLTLQNEILKVLSDGKSRSIVELSKEIKNSSCESIFWILRHSCHNNNEI